MKLYEITIGRTGESYVRLYVWAKDDEQAYDLAGAQLDKAGYQDTTQMSLKELFSDSDPAFCTTPSDSGWEREPAKRTGFPIPGYPYAAD